MNSIVPIVDAINVCEIANGQIMFTYSGKNVIESMYYIQFFSNKKIKFNLFQGLYTKLFSYFKRKFVEFIKPAPQPRNTAGRG